MEVCGLGWGGGGGDLGAGLGLLQGEEPHLSLKGELGFSREEAEGPGRGAHRGRGAAQ